MKITYGENAKMHVLESDTGFVATYPKAQLTKEEAEQSFKLALKMIPQEEESVQMNEDYTEFEEVKEPVKKETNENGKK